MRVWGGGGCGFEVLGCRKLLKQYLGNTFCHQNGTLLNQIIGVFNGVKGTHHFYPFNIL